VQKGLMVIMKTNQQGKDPKATQGDIMDAFWFASEHIGGISLARRCELSSNPNITAREIKQ